MFEVFWGAVIVLLGVWRLYFVSGEGIVIIYRVILFFRRRGGRDLDLVGRHARFDVKRLKT